MMPATAGSHDQAIIWTSPCGDWQIDFDPDIAFYYGPRALGMLEEALEEHATECASCAAVLADDLERRRRARTAEAQANIRREVRREEVARIMTATLAELDRADDPVARAVLDLHSRNDSRTPGCEGCDPGSYAADAAEWPCSTIETVAKALGLEWPDDAYLWRPGL